MWGYLSTKTRGEIACETIPMTIFAGVEASCPRASGNLEVLKYLKPIRVWNDDMLCNVAKHAAAKGHIATLDWLYIKYDRNIRYIDYTVDICAAKYGQIKVLRWLVRHNSLSCNSVVRTAVEYGQIEVLDWIVDQGCNIRHEPGLVDHAVISGQLKSLKWLRRCRGNINTESGNVFVLACRTGNLDIVKWLHSLGFAMGQTSVSAATEAGNLEVLK
jgi:ankyrin repeat protein